MTGFLQPPISNGNPREQALIRRWWEEKKSKEGSLVWEYYLEGKYADAILFPNSRFSGSNFPGVDTANRFPLSGQDVILCEAKIDLTPEVVGQALIYAEFVKSAGANILETVIFCETGGDSMKRAAGNLGLSLEIAEL